MRDSIGAIFAVFLRLGLTSFGGPIAHLGYYRTEFVARRRWLSEAAYADLVALCQLLPGPASTQVSFAVGLARGGLAGGLAAWLGFTLPSAVAMVLFAQGAAALTGPISAGMLHGLQVVAVAVVAQAVWSMARTLSPDRPRATIAIVATLIVTAAPTAIGQIAAIVAGAAAGAWLCREGPALGATERLSVPVPRALALAALALFALLLIGLPIAVAVSPALAVVDAFYRAGALVFGGGHVVLPLLHASVVVPGWVGEEAFLSGYGAAQAVPGPLFTFAAYLGAIMTEPPAGWPGAALCLVAIFLPGLLLVLGVLPFWVWLGRAALMPASLRGVNAAVVGVLLGALYDPVWTKGIGGPADFALALVAFALLVVWKAPPWLVVLVSAAGGAAVFGR
jgi:chromate transporter